ncbi:MAG: hypothetical protein H8E31_03000 [Planctomycetes bacterium]|nr:hypothetical protein [Planctomycetota bacterium]
MRQLPERAHGAPQADVARVPAGLPQALSFLWPGLSSGSDRLRRFLLGLRGLCSRRARVAGLRLRDFAPPHAEGAGARLASRDPAAGSFAYPVGWCPLEATVVPPAAAFAAAPWLELSAAAALNTPELRRIVAAGPST